MKSEAAAFAEEKISKVKSILADLDQDCDIDLTTFPNLERKAKETIADFHKAVEAFTDKANVTKDELVIKMLKIDLDNLFHLAMRDLGEILNQGRRKQKILRDMSKLYREVDIQWQLTKKIAVDALANKGKDYLDRHELNAKVFCRYHYWCSSIWHESLPGN